MKKQIFLLTALAFLAVTANANKWRVNNTPGIDADFTTFKAAHDGASSGDTLYFEGSPTAYGTNDTITKQLVIIGPGYFLNENDTTQAYVVSAKMHGLAFLPGSAGSVVAGMHFTWSVDLGANNITIERNFINFFLHLYAYVDDSYLGCANCIIKQNYITAAIQGTDYAAASNILISNNIMEERMRFYSNSSAIIENNIIISSSYTECIDVHNSTIRNNIVVGTIDTNTGNLIENNLTNITQSDVFILTGSTDGQYKLKDGSPAIGAGHSGVDCGIFGGSQPYVLSGIPAGPHIFDASVSTSGSTESGLPVTLKIKTQN